MATSYTRTPHKSPMHKYNSISSQLDNETSVLISQRDQISKSGHKFNPEHKKLSRTGSGYKGSKVNETKDKINGVVGLVQNDMKNGNSQFNKIMTAQKQILDLLKQTSNFTSGKLGGKKVKGWSLEDITQEDIDFLRSLDKQELIRMLLEALRMYREQKGKRMWIENELKRILGVDSQINPQYGRNDYSQNINLAPEFGTASYTIKPLSSVPYRGSYHSGSRSIINQQHNLNDQIKDLKAKLSAAQKQGKEYKRQLDRLRQKSDMGGLQLGKQGFNGLLDLYKQGQNIRDQTACLIRTKEGQSSKYPYQKIKELERQLEDQQQAKVAFLSDLKKFKLKFKNIQEQNIELKNKLKNIEQQKNYQTKSYKQNITRTTYA